MALKKTMEHVSGAKASYWNFGGAVVSKQEKTAQFIFLGYIDEGFARAGKQPLDARRLEIKGPEYDALLGGDKIFKSSIVDIAYAAARAHPEFFGAESDNEPKPVSTPRPLTLAERARTAEPAPLPLEMEPGL